MLKKRIACFFIVIMVLVLVNALFSKQQANKSQVAAARLAVESLKHGDFVLAEKEAAKVLSVDPNNPQALLVKGIASYRSVTKKLTAVLNKGLERYVRRRNFSHSPIRRMLKESLSELAKIEKLLKKVSQYQWVYLELSPASWRIDWNGNGRIDASDRRLLQIEFDKQGKAIPAGNPRRKPTYRFDVGDVYWGLAYLSFQQAALNLLLAYEMPDPTKLLLSLRRGARFLTIKLVGAKHVTETKKFILQGLLYSGKARVAYLNERDDDREWVPNPNQKSSPMLLPINSALYASWKGALRDVAQLVKGNEGLDLRAVASLFLTEKKMERDFPVTGYLNFGSMLSKPRDIRLDVRKIQMLWMMYSRAKGMQKGLLLQQLLVAVFGDNYSLKMKASPITKRLLKMRNEVMRGEESLNRKLRYLLWIN